MSKIRIINDELGLETDQEFEVKEEKTVTYVTFVHPVHGDVMVYKGDTEEIDA